MLDMHGFRSASPARRQPVGAAVPRSAAIHALTAGAMATMILAVMTRASLGHTARELKANAATVVIYLLVTAGAVFA